MLMQARDYFPLGIATGKAFCNRQEETELLIENIKSGKHTLLIAPRRYGKSSVAFHAINLSNLPYSEIDFYMARNEKVIESYILKGIIEAIGNALGPIDKLVTSIKRYVKNLKPKLDIGTNTIKLELTVDATTDPATNVKEGLLLLEHLLAEKQKRAVLLMDEFQNVGLIAKGMGIEGAIRNVAQKTKYLTIIFSGSSRKLLLSMFEDDTRPLYKLCWQMHLKRIATEHYYIHIQKAAQLAWARNLGESEFDMIISLTERHPYYLNKLCDKIITYYKKPPSLENIKNVWQKILEEEASDAIKEISSLSLGQKTLLLHIANGFTANFTNKQTMLNLQMISSSILSALTGLEEKDIIEKEDNNYKIINPVIKYYVQKSG